MENNLPLHNQQTEQSGEISQKISSLETKFNNMYNYLSRSSVAPQETHEDSTSLNNYLRNSLLEGFVQKSLNSAEQDGSVLLTPTLYEKILTGITARSPMRQLASREVISSNALDLIIEDGKFNSGWVGETEIREVTDNPKLLQKRIMVHELYAQPKATQKLLDDSAIQVEHWLSERLRDSFLRAENEAFILGDGNKKPIGILHPNNAIEKIEHRGAIGITTDDLLNLINALDEEYLANTTFLMNRTTLSEIQKLKDDNGRFIWQQSISDSFTQTIFGIPIVCSSNMPAISRDSLAIALGDFKEAYKIVDRAEIHIMKDPYTEKPFVKFYAVKRVGGDVVNPKALKLLKISE